MTENFSRLTSDTNKPQIQEAQRIWLLHVMLLLIHPTIMVPLTMWADCGIIHNIPKTQNGYGSL